MPAQFGHHIQERTFKVSIKAVQRKAAWFVKNNYGFTSSVTAILKDLGWPTFKKEDGY